MIPAEEARALPVSDATAFNPAIGPSTQGLGDHLVATRALDDGEAFRRVRDEGLEIVRRNERADELMARGAAFGRDEFIAFVLDELAPAAS